MSYFPIATGIILRFVMPSSDGVVRRKDTLSNIEETGEFVVNVVVDDIAGSGPPTALKKF